LEIITLALAGQSAAGEGAVPDRLKDKVCVITGTGDGMGRAAALLFCAEGACVVGCDIDAAKAERTVGDATSAGGRMVSLHPRI
jgi:NAD(P)-dependent dehydrogenase (short-subunit alcohol dehydrogenase family)